MFVPLWLIGLTLALLVLLATLAFRRGDGEDMIERQRRASPAHARTPSPTPASTPAPTAAPTNSAQVFLDRMAVLAHPDVRAALDNGHKIEAIKLVRERTGLGLKEAKDLVERRAR